MTRPSRVQEQQTVHLASHVALEATDDLLLAEPLASAASDVLKGTGIGSHAAEHDDPQGPVRVGIAGEF